jgi:hypothetical protein
MNEVARSTQIALGIAATAARTARAADPIALVDLGTGAGLGLALDQYRYLVGGVASGPADARLTLTCAVRGRGRPPRADLPRIAARAGIELSPVDVTDPDSRAWLVACTPPEASALSRLALAIEVTAARPARIVAGDVLAELPGVLETLPAGLPVTVVDASLAVFLAPAERRRLGQILRRAAARRRVTWLSLDPLVPLGPAGRKSVQGLPLPPAIVRDYQQAGVFAVLGARTFDRDGDQGDDTRLLARAHPSGQWVEWLS